MPQLDNFTYITQVYTIIGVFVFLFLFLAHFWQVILLQGEIIALQLKQNKKANLFFLFQSLFIKQIIYQPAFFVQYTLFYFVAR